MRRETFERDSQSTLDLLDQKNYYNHSIRKISVIFEIFFFLHQGLISDEDEEHLLSPAEQRALRAEKRAAWRQARLKSLEQVKLEAQFNVKMEHFIVKYLYNFFSIYRMRFRHRW